MNVRVERQVLNVGECCQVEFVKRFAFWSGGRWVTLWCHDLDVDSDVENPYKGDSEVVSWSFNSPWKHRVIRMMFFQFRHVYKGLLLCCRRLFAGKRSGEENLWNRVWMDSNRSKTACPMFCRIACWSDIALAVCGLGSWGTWLRNCPCCRMSAVCETLRMRIIASPVLLPLTHNSCWRHCKPYHHSPSPSPSCSHVEMKKYIACMSVILLQHQLATWPESFTVSWPCVSHALAIKWFM